MIPADPPQSPRLQTVVFLDVHGVLVHADSVGGGNASGEPYGSSFYHAACVDVEAVRRVMSLVDQTDAKLVLTSDWRLHDATTTGLRRAFLRAEVPRERLRTLFLRPTPQGLNRSEEISAWLKAWPTPVRALVVDDHPVPGHAQVSPLPQFSHGGFQDEHLAIAVRMLTPES